MKGLLVLIGFALAGCGYLDRHEPTEPVAMSDRQLLKEKRDAKLETLRSLLDPATGWPSLTDCDGTLWASELCLLGEPVQIELAEHRLGEIHRRPFEACWDPELGDR